MKTHIGQTITRNVLALIIPYGLTFVVIQLAQRTGRGWPTVEIGQDVSFVAALFMALALGARPMAYVWAALAAFGVSELCIHWMYGVRAAQGAHTHFAVMGAAFVAVALGALVSRRSAFILD